MYIPPPSASTLAPAYYSTASVFFADDGDSDKSKQQKWSSLIGVTTAIIGNVLISFALNTQRYAHMHLSREREEQAEKQRRSRRGHKKSLSYGTQQSDIVEERAQLNAKAEPIQDDLEEGQGGETEPLIPRSGMKGLEREGEEDEGGDDEKSVKEKSYLGSPIWWAGITMMVLGEAGNFLAYGFAPASIVSPLGVVALVSNCLIAPLLLHERFRWRDALGVVIAVAGCVTVVLSASDSNPKLGPDEIWDLISQWEFETYLGITVFLIIALAVASNKFGERTILIDLGLVGLFGGYTALSTKGVASLLSNTIWRVVTFPITYLLVAVLVFTAIMQIKYVNRALQRFNSTMVIPTQFVLFTISVILGSAILYRDFERTTPEDAGKFVGGCALTFLGVWCITTGRNDSDTEGDEEMTLGEEDDAINLLDEEGQQPEVRERDDNDGRKPSIINSSSKSTPRVTPVADEELAGTSYRSSYFTPQSHDHHAYEPLPPANASAIHSASTSDLPSGLASESDNRDFHPPPFHATTSAPIVPTTNAPSPRERPQTPLRRGVTHTDGSPPHAPMTPWRQSGTQPLPRPHFDPSATSPDKQRRFNRHSVAGLFPAPFTSPLSNSLSAIVADSLRRGVDAAHVPSSASPLRRRSTKFRRKGTGDSATTPLALGPKRHSIASGEWHLDENDDDRPSGGRLRSLSATLGEAFGSVRGKARSRNAATGERRERVPEEDAQHGPGSGGTETATASSSSSS